MQYSRFLYLLSLLLLTTVFYNCQPEDISEDYFVTSDLKISTDQEGFTLVNYTDEWVKDDLIVDWDHPVTIKKDDKAVVEEFSTNLIQVLSPEKTADNYKINIVYKILKTTIGIKSSYSVVQFQSLMTTIQFPLKH